MNRLGRILALFVLTVGLASAATITVKSPKEHGANFYCKGKPYGIGWSKDGTMPDTVKITLRNKASTAEVLVIAATAPNNGQYYPWTIPATLADGQYVVRVKATGAAVHGDSEPFTINTCPEITITSPKEGTVYQETTTQTITWTKAGSLPNTVRIELWDENKNVARVIAAAAPNTGLFSWTVPGNLTIGNYFINVAARLNPTGDSIVIQDTHPIKIALKIIVPGVQIKK